MQAMQDFIKAIIVYNPLDLSSAQTVELEYAPVKPLSCYIDGLPEDVNWAVAVDGVQIDIRAADLIIPPAGSTIVVVPEIEGGGNGGNMLAIVATVALSVLAPGIGSTLATSFGFSSTGIAATLFAAGVSVAGGMLISAMMPVAETADLETVNEKSSWGIDGAKNTSTENIPVPVIYGEHAFGGNYIDLYTENTVDSDGNSTQIVYGRIAISEGPIHSVYDLKINDQSIDNYENVTIDYRLGTENQEVSDWFDQTITLVNDGRTVGYESNVTYTTSQEVDKLRVDIVFPSGHYTAKKESVGYKTNTVQIAVKWRKSGTEDWTYLAFDSDSLPIGVSEQNLISLSHATAKAVRKSFFTPVLEEGVYDVKIERHTIDNTRADMANDFVLSDVGEIILDSTSLPYTAWVGFRAMLSDDITGVPKLTGTAKGRIVNIYDHNGNIVDERWSNNPRDIELDMLFNTRYGASAPTESIDFAARQEWADFCDENDLTFNGVFDTMSNIEDESKHVYVAGRAERISNGAKSSVAFDAPSDPVMLFGEGNMVDGSFELTYVGTSERVNDIEVQFFDKDSDYEQSSARQVDEASIARGMPVKSSSIFRKGITDIERADREAVLLMNKNNLIRRTAKWQSPIEALHCVAGDVVRVQRSEVDWQEGGRILSTSVDSGVVTFTLDHPVKVRSDRNYSIVVHMNATTIGAFSVSSQTGNLITVNGTVPELSKLRVSDGVNDIGVSRVISGDSTTDLLLEVRAQNISLSGKSITIHRTDDMVSYDVDSVEDTVTTDKITVSTGVDEPAPYANFVFGKKSDVERLFRVKTIEYENGAFSIEAIEYNEDVYSDTPVVPSVKSTGSAKTFANVLNLDAEEVLTQLPNGTYKSTARATWDAPASGDYKFAIVQASVNGAPYKRVGRDTSSFDLEGEVGDVVAFRVLARTADGVVAAKQAPVATVTLAGSQYIPDAPDNWAAKSGARTVTLVMDGSIEDGISFFRFYGAGSEAEFSSASMLGEGRVTSFVANPNGSADIGRYWVTAVSIGGLESAASDPIDALPKSVSSGDLDEEIQDKLNTVDELVETVTEFLATNAVEMTSLVDGQALANEAIEAANTHITSVEEGVASTNENVAAAVTRISDLEDGATIASAAILSAQEAIAAVSTQLATDAADIRETVVAANASISSLSTIITDVSADVQAAREEASESISEASEAILSSTSIDIADALTEAKMLIADEVVNRAAADVLNQSSNVKLQVNLDDASASFQEQIDVLVGVDTAVAERVTTLEASVADNAAAITETQTAMADADTAAATRMTGIEASVVAANSRIDATQTAMATADGALAESIETLETETNNAISAVSTSVTSVSNSVTALASTITNLNTEYEGNKTSVASSLETLASADTALANSVSSLATTVANNKSAVDTSIQTLTTADAALSKSLTDYIASVGSQIASIQTSIQANATANQSVASELATFKTSTESSISTINQKTTSLTEADSALAESIADLSTTVDNNAATAQSSITALTERDTAIAKSVTDLGVVVNENAASFNSSVTTLTNADKAISDELTELKAEYGTNKTSVAASLTSLANADRAISESITDLGAEFDENKATVAASLTSLANADASLSSTITSLQTVVANNKSSADASITSLTNADTALSKSITDLSADYENNKTTVSETLATLATADSTIAESVTALATEYGTNKTSVSNAITALTSEDEALADLITDLSTSFDNKTSEIEQSVTTVSNAVSSNAQAITSLKTDTEAATAALSNSLTTLSDDQSATAQAQEDLSASLADLTDTVEADLETERFVRAAADVVNAAYHVGVTASMNDNFAAVDERMSTMVTDSEAVAERLTTLETSFGDASSTFSSDITSVSDDLSSAVGRIDTLESSFGDTAAIFTDEVTTFADAIQAISSSIQTLSSSVDTANSSITDVSTTASEETQAVATRVTDIETSLGDTTAIFTDEVTTFADTVSALASRTSTLETNYGNAATLFVEDIQGFSDEVSALSELVTSVQATFGDTSSIFTEEVTNFADAHSALASKYDELIATYGSTEDAASYATAAATSATSAASSATSAGVQASAAQASKLAAETAASNATVAKNAAVTAKDEAEESASSAAESATLAATSANEAGDSADASASSASVASTKASEASVSATAANSSRLAAEAAATEASGSADDAAAASSSATIAKNDAVTAKNSAASSASTASTYATNAANSATAAGNSATAASTSASTASTKATEASTAATTATTMKNEATTAKNSAYTYSQNAATSATNAEGSASLAQTYMKAAQQMIGSEAFPNATIEWDDSLSKPLGFAINTNSTAGQIYAKKNGKYNSAIQLISPSATEGIAYHPYVTLSSAADDSLDLPVNPNGTKGLRLTLEIERVSGEWGGACVRVGWISSGTGGTNAYTYAFFADSLAAQNGVVQTLEVDLFKPSSFVKGSDGGYIVVQIFCNSEFSGRTRTACTLNIHRVSVKQLTELSSAYINLQSINDIKGNLASMATFAATAGGEVSLLELTAADGSGGSFSIAKLQAADIILDGSIGAAKFSSTLSSDNYSAGKKGWKIYRNNDDVSAEFNGVVLSRQLKLNSGSFVYSGTISSGSEVVLPFVNTGIIIGPDDVWTAKSRTFMATVSAVPTNGSGVGSGSLWRAKADVYEGFKWNGSVDWNSSKGFQYTWTEDPATTVTPDWSTGGGQRILMDISVRASLLSMTGPITISWVVYEVT